MYREEILDLYRNPRNTGSLENALEAEGENPSCGDETRFYVKTEDGKISALSHESEACAICTAANSIVSEKLVGRETDEVLDLERDWIIDELGIEISPMRVKCAVLGLKTVQKALKE